MSDFRDFPLETLRESGLNPRRHYDAGQLAELTESIRTKGILQPLVVRPNGSGFEIVCGSRRFRAAKAAGLATVPGLVRELTDQEVIELAVIENLQRADVHPLEEAEGYEQLIAKHGYTAEDLAAKIGKSKAYVYARMKLCALSAKAREAFYAGKLNPSTALLVARIPGAKLQDQATKEITEPDYRGDVLPVRQAAEHIHRCYMLRLKDAPFAIRDAALVAKAGACGPCPKRTGNQPELFEDVGSADVCTDPACFAAKKEAHFAVLRKAAEAKGQKVIAGKVAKEIAPYGQVGGGYRALADSIWLGQESAKVADLVKQVPEVEVHWLEQPKTRELVPIVEEKPLKAALKKAGLLPKGERANLPATNSEYKREQAKKEARAELERTVRWRVLDAIRGKVTATGQVTRDDGADVLCALWECIADGSAYYEDLDRLAITYGWLEPDQKTGHTDDSSIAMRTRLPTLTAPEIWGVLLDLALLDQAFVTAFQSAKSGGDRLFAAAARHGVDVDAIRAEVTATAKQAAKAEKPAAKSPAKAKARATEEATQ